MIANDLLAKNLIEKHTVIYTDNQTHGKGQRGNSWESLPNLNATFSIVLKPDQIRANDQFSLHIITSLAIKRALADIVDVNIKWPNDIYVNHKKIGGILIENTLRGSFLGHSIVGIGININQTQFQYKHASSIKLEIGKNCLIDDIIERILIQLENNLDQLMTGDLTSMKTEYTRSLYQLGKKNKYQTANGIYEGVIKGITETGKLKIEFGADIQTFDFKEVKFLQE